MHLSPLSSSTPSALSWEIYPLGCPQTIQKNVYYKVQRQLFKSTTSCFRYKVWRVLQSATTLLESALYITTWDDYYSA